jgi:glutamate carboxypeptidase
VISISGSSGTNEHVSLLAMDPWIRDAAAEIAKRAPRELEALVAVSSPSGDVHGANECAAVCAALAPDEATIERVPCSSPGHADDFVARIHGTGSGKALLVGHVDTVVAHTEHRPLQRVGEQLLGSGSVDMKAGDILAIGALRAFAKRPGLYEQIALLLVCDEEWRTADFGHVPRFAGFDACLCFEAGELAGEDEGVVVRRKAAGTIHVTARGRTAHSGSAPDRGRNALLALARAAQAVASQHDPHGPDHLSAVPTVLHSGEAFNVVPGAGELFCDVRADDLEAIERIVPHLPDEVGGATLHPELIRRWPGMHSEAAVAPVLERASAALGRRIAPAARGGASDASHFAATIPITVDGLGPRGGKAHNPEEFVLEASLQPRAEVALAVILAALADAKGVRPL